MVFWPIFYAITGVLLVISLINRIIDIKKRVTDKTPEEHLNLPAKT